MQVVPAVNDEKFDQMIEDMGVRFQISSEYMKELHEAEDILLKRMYMSFHCSTLMIRHWFRHM